MSWNRYGWGIQQYPERTHLLRSNPTLQILFGLYHFGFAPRTHLENLRPRPNRFELFRSSHCNQLDQCRRRVSGKLYGFKRTQWRTRVCGENRLEDSYDQRVSLSDSLFKQSASEHRLVSKYIFRNQLHDRYARRYNTRFQLGDQFFKCEFGLLESTARKCNQSPLCFRKSNSGIFLCRSLRRNSQRPKYGTPLVSVFGRTGGRGMCGCIRRFGLVCGFKCVQ